MKNPTPRWLIISIAVVGFLVFVRIMAGRQEEQCSEAMTKAKEAFGRQAYDDARRELGAAADLCKSLREGDRRELTKAINLAQGIEEPAATRTAPRAPAATVASAAPGRGTTMAQEAAGLVGANGEISAAQYGDDWPLTVSAGRLICQPPSRVFFQAPGTPVYAVNGAAEACIENSGGCGGIKAKDIDPIWKPDTKLGHGLKKSIGPLIDAGLSYCAKQGY